MSILCFVEIKFEETIEKLERGSGQTVVTLREARALVGRTGLADHILLAVYDYWLNKRLATQQPLLLAVRTEPRPGAPQASPYLAFRRRTEKMQTRKNRFDKLYWVFLFLTLSGHDFFSSLYSETLPFSVYC